MSEFVSFISDNSFSMNNSQIAKLLCDFGNATSSALLDPVCEKFSISEVEGVIGYRMKRGCAVVFGDPVCDQRDLAKLVNSFHQFCREKNKKVIYVAASAQFADWALQNTCKASIKIGEEVILNPQNNHIKGHKGRKLRAKINYARKSGISVNEFFNDDENLRKKIEHAASSWLHARKGPQIYLSHLNLFEFPFGKRWFYADDNGEIVGVLLISQLNAFKGWLTNFFITTPKAIKGTSELLMISALKILKEEKCAFLSIGTIPGEELGEMTGIGLMTKWLAKIGFKIVKVFFRLNGKKRYWKKFNPNFEKSYVLFEKRQIRLSDILAIVSALNGQL